MEHETGEHRGRGHGGVVGPGELGVGQQRVEEPARQVVSFEVTGLMHCPDQWSHDRFLHFWRTGLEDVEDVEGEIEDGYVVDVFADMPPCLAEAFEPSPLRFLHFGYPVYMMPRFVGAVDALLPRFLH